MRATYLTGERVYLRGMVEDDKYHAIAWYDTVFPVNSAFAEEQSASTELDAIEVEG